MREVEDGKDSESKWHRGTQWYAAAIFLLYAGLMFWHTAPPSLTDYANWTYQGVLLRDHLLGIPDASHTLKNYPVPNSAATFGIGVLALVLPWVIAAKTWLCLQLLLSFVAMRSLLQTTGANWAAWVVVPTAVFLNTNFWYGFVNFQLGLCWLMLVASLLLMRERSDTEELKQEWVFGLLLLLAFFTHMIPFVFASLLLALYARQTRRFRILWQLAPAGIATLWYVLGRYLFWGNADGQAGMVSPVRTYSAAFWAYKANSYLKSFGFINPGTQSGSEDITVFGRGLFVFLFLVNVLLCLSLGWMMVRAARRAIRQRAGQRFIWYGVALILPLYLAAPGTALGMSDPGSRLLQTALALAVVLCMREGGRLRVTAMVCATVLAMVGSFLFARLGFLQDQVVRAAAGAPLPHAMVVFAHVPNSDQDYFYKALDRGEMDLPVFPTGMFLDLRKEPSPKAGDGSVR